MNSRAPRAIEPSFEHKEYTAFVGGEWIGSNKTFTVRSPISSSLTTEVADCGENEARMAVDSAVTAFELWRDVSSFERSRILSNWNDLILQNRERIANTISLEMGKPISEARGEVAYAATFVEWYAEEAKRIYGETFSGPLTHKRLYALRQPVGPTYAITPWNFPAAMVTRKAAPALAAGCTVILKPAEQSPLTALLLARFWQEAGGPAGTLHVLTTSDPVSVTKVMIQDERIRKLTFTGSTEVGRQLYQQAARTIKRVSLELGGHAPFLIFADADIDAAVREVMASKFRNSGQTCVCVNRIYVHRFIEDQFAEKLSAAVSGLKVGDPLDEGTQIGPLVDQQGVDKVCSHVDDALGKGATALVGGARRNGLFFDPTVLASVRPGMRILDEETFGPVAPLISFESDENALRMANDTPYGLAAYLWTRDLERAHRMSERLEYGIVGVNDGAPSAAQAPFGGIKSSGLGREGGPWGLQEFLDVKYVSVALTPHGVRA